MARFTAKETQRIKITFQVNRSISFIDNPEEVEDFASAVVDNVIDCCDGDIYDCEVDDMALDEVSLEPGNTYSIDVICWIYVSGTCTEYHGKKYGDPYFCEPDYIDDVEYEDGMIETCNLNKLQGLLPELSNINVTIGEISYDGEFDLSFDEDYDDGPDYDRFED